MDEEWNENVPNDDTLARDIDNEVREFKRAIRERLAEEHNFYEDESDHDDVGEHKRGSARVEFGSSSDSKPDNNSNNPGLLFCETDTGRIFFDDGSEWIDITSDIWDSIDDNESSISYNESSISDNEELANPQKRFQVSGNIGGFDERYDLPENEEIEIYTTHVRVPGGKKLILKRARVAIKYSTGKTLLVRAYDRPNWECSDGEAEHTPDFELYENDVDYTKTTQLKVLIENTGDSELNLYSYDGFWLDLAIEE